MIRQHNYTVNVKWCGNLGTGTSDYSHYSRNHDISVHNKPLIMGSSDPSFYGDQRRYNPEELLVSSLSACHMLWYLHLCADSGIVIIEYVDNAQGIMIEQKDGSGKFQKVILSPEVAIFRESNASIALELHKKAHSKCFIANSVNFPVECNPNILINKHLDYLNH